MYFGNIELFTVMQIKQFWIWYLDSGIADMMQIISKDATITKLGTKHQDGAGRQDEARVNLCSSQRNTAA